MRILTIDEMAAVSGGADEGGVRLGTISIGRDSGRSDGAGGGRDNMGHSVARQTNRDEVTGYVVFPGGQAAKKTRLANGTWIVEGGSVSVGTGGVNGTVSFKKRESHN